MTRQTSDSPSDVFALLERLPFIGSIARDVTALRALLVDRRMPRVLIVGARESGKTALARALIGADARTLPAEIAVESPHGAWTELGVEGRRLAWLEHPLGALSADTHRLVGNALAESPPDVIVALIRADQVDLELPELTTTLTKLLDRLGDIELALQPVVTHADRLCVPVEFARPPFPHDVLARLDSVGRRVAGALAPLRVRARPPLAVAVPPTPDTWWGLAELGDALLDVMPAAARLEAVRGLPVPRASVRKLTQKLAHHTSAIAVTVGLAPIPFSDAVVLVPMQAIMITAIAYAAGQPWDRRAAVEWLGSLGVTGGVAFGMRWSAQQLAKLVPGAGTLVSASVAGAGTLALGRSAIAYFVDGAGYRGRG